VRLDGGEHLRSYSMSSSPETDTEMTVTVKRVPGGLVSNWFNDNVAVGDLVEATRPAGVFCVRETGRSGRRVLRRQWGHAGDLDRQERAGRHRPVGCGSSTPTATGTR
jgi:hypothetical protein